MRFPDQHLRKDREEAAVGQEKILAARQAQ